MVGERSWHLLTVFGLSPSDLKYWKSRVKMARIFYYFVKPITCVNDIAQRNICILQDFINDFMRQMMSGKAFSMWSDKQRQAFI